MPIDDEKNNGFFQEKTSGIISKVEKTPMEKFFVFFLILISASALILGYLQFKKDIEAPGYTNYLTQRRGQLIDQYTNIVPTNQDVINKLRNQDSDLDGLSDYDEIYVYHTNPYVTDSDGDGISDKQEILNGTDPNCPQGQDCSNLSNLPTTPLNGNANSNDNINAIIANLGDADMQTIMQYEQDLLTGKKTLADLGINSPELQKIFDQLRASAASQAGNLNATDQSQALANLEQMTPQQIRDELIKRGMDKATVDQIDDASLTSLFQQVINSYK